MTAGAEVASGLVDELRAASAAWGGKSRYDRPAVPTVYAERNAFIATGRYPYNADVEATIIVKFGVPEDLHRQLASEVYLASGQRQAAEMVDQEQAGLAEGFQPITELEPVEGRRVELRGKAAGPFRVKPDGRGGWGLIPRGKRTHGYRLDELVRCHAAFEKAKARNQTAMDGPSVVMFREAAS